MCASLDAFVYLYIFTYNGIFVDLKVKHQQHYYVCQSGCICISLPGLTSWLWLHIWFDITDRTLHTAVIACYTTHGSMHTTHCSQCSMHTTHCSMHIHISFGVMPSTASPPVDAADFKMHWWKRWQFGLWQCAISISLPLPIQKKLFKMNLQNTYTQLLKS